MTYQSKDGERYTLQTAESTDTRVAHLLTKLRLIAASDSPEAASDTATEIQVHLDALTPAGLLQLHDIAAVTRRMTDTRIALAGGLQATIDAAVLTGELLVVDPTEPESTIQAEQEATDE